MEGLCHSAGPQLCAGLTLGVGEHHLHLPPWDLRIHYTKLPAGSVCAQSSYKVRVVLLGFAGRIHSLSFLFSGVFMFLWSMALTCKNRSDDKSSSVRDPSTQKMMTTSFNN